MQSGCILDNVAAFLRCRRQLRFADVLCVCVCVCVRVCARECVRKVKQCVLVLLYTL